MPRKLTTIALSLCALLACACASAARSNAQGGAAEKGEPLRMAVTDYRSGATFELVNKSHTDPIEQYSKVRADASRKVQDDELMSALHGWILDHQFDRYAHGGHAPALAKNTKAWSLEIETPKGPRYVLVTPETPAKDQETLRELREAVIATYNQTQGWQAVDIKNGKAEDFFNEHRPQPPSGKKP